MKRASPIKQWILTLYDSVVDVIMIGLVLLMLVVLGFAFYDVLTNLIHLIPGFRTSGVDEPEFRELVGNVLDVFVVVELFSTFINYLRTGHVRLSTLLDVTVVFALRELLVKLYSAEFSNEQLIGLCLVVIMLVVARSITGRFPPKTTPASDL